MIATLTLNPALDEAVETGTLHLGATNRCSLDALEPGGKGINASRVIHRLGRATCAFGFVGGVTGQIVRARIESEGVPTAFEEVDEPTRINVIVLEREGARRTQLHLPGARVEPARAGGLAAHIADRSDVTTVVLAGSLPPGLEPDTYGDLIAPLRARGFAVILDTSGPALAHALGARPTLIKPDVEEAEALLGRPLPDDAAVLAGALEIRARGPEYVVISQGKDGAIAVGPDGAWKARAPAVTAHATVGCGDSMVAGIAVALSERRPFSDALLLGTACGAATAAVPGTKLCSAADVERIRAAVEVHPI